MNTNYRSRRKDFPGGIILAIGRMIHCPRLFFVPLLILPFFMNRTLAEENAAVNYLGEEASKIDWQKLEPYIRVHVALQAALWAHELKKTELERLVYRVVLDSAREFPDCRFHGQLVRFALSTDQFELAESFAGEAEKKNDRLQDEILLARYKAGNLESLDSYPLAPLDFYNGLALINCYIKSEEYEKAVEFVSKIEIPPESDLDQLAPLAHKMIAEAYETQGNLAQAKEHFDRAMQIGGGLYYTGFLIQVKHKSIHGRLAEDSDQMSTLGANYGDHMGRELVQSLTSELVRKGHLEEAKKAATKLESEVDRDHVLAKIARVHFKRGEHELCNQEIATMKNSNARLRAQIDLALDHWRLGEHSQAESIAASVFKALNQEPMVKHDYLRWELATAFCVFDDRESLKTLVDSVTDKTTHAYLIGYALENYPKVHAEE
jgi:tetratricopeptide (TPR) repeat protein